MGDIARSLAAFIAPDIYSELGEFQRVGELLGVDSATLMYIALNEGELVVMNDDIEERLGNCDFAAVKIGDWQAVESLSRQSLRDYEDLRRKLEVGHEVDAPIVMKYRNNYHLVSGNTRLMVAKALGLCPHLLLFEVYDNETGF